MTPLQAGVARAGGASGELLRTPGSSAAFNSARLRVIATWSGEDRAVVARALRHRLISEPPPPAPPVQTSVTRAGRQARGPLARPAEAVYPGSGFDACTAPSSTTMTAWGSSPYRAIGVYIGGVNEGCSQPNLTAAWVSAEVGAGWHLIPTYVGLQGAGSCGGGCATITPSEASAQGAAAASDAVTQAQALGIGAGNPIYDDMEQYTTGGTNSSTVLAYLSGWTGQLHAEGYLSGVYSSASSGITDLVNADGTGYAEPDDLWIAHWDGQPTTSDSYVPSSDWANQQRIRQYQGDHSVTYGGVTLDIDSDYLDGATADTGGASPSVIPDGTFVQLTGSTEVFRIAGGAPLLVNDLSQFGNPTGRADHSDPVRRVALLPRRRDVSVDQPDGAHLPGSRRRAVQRQHLGHLRWPAAEHPDRPVGHPEHREPVRAPTIGAARLHDRRGAPVGDLLAVRGRAAHGGPGDARGGRSRRCRAGRIPGRRPVRRRRRRSAELRAAPASQGDAEVRGSAPEAPGPHTCTCRAQEGKLPAG